mmetsp:Transcript_52/g.65  ORF Transcript_52/g.65 Transcript_52/m.65 type:complete len:412 (+) Transcript_52:95-1330(+)
MNIPTVRVKAKTKAKRCPPFHLLMVSILIFFHQLEPSESYASWFVEHSSSCWTDIRDTTEVVMNSFIVPFSDSAHADHVHIQMLDKNNDMQPVPFDNSHDNVIYIEESDLDLIGSESELTFEYVLKLNVNPDAKLYDLQYVMDVQISPILDDEEIEQLDGTETRLKAEFTYNKGCYNMRAYGRNVPDDKGLELIVQIPKSIFTSQEIQMEEHYIDIVAGWACGHEPVTLTQNIRIKPVKSRKDNGQTRTVESNTGGDTGTGTDTDTDSENTKSQTIVEEQKQEEKQQQSEQQTEKVMDDDDHDLLEGQEAIKRQEQINHQDDDRHNHDNPNQPQHHQKKKQQHPKKKIHAEDKNLSEPVRTFNEKYQRKNFGLASFSTTAHITGLCISAIFTFIVIKVCLATSKKKIDKEL